jgi:hypothetical protein
LIAAATVASITTTRIKWIIGRSGENVSQINKKHKY